MKYPRDPPSVHSGKVATASVDSKKSYEGSQKAEDTGNPSSDDFDRFMENPDFMTPTNTKTVSFDPKDDTTADDYISARFLSRSSPRRPASSDFTPRSHYSSSSARTSFSPNAKTGQTKEESPTSVMDVPTNPVLGVRWSENLTQQQFVSPQYSRLDPYSTDRMDTPMGKPKSILRKRSNRPGLSPQKEEAAYFPYDEDREFPLDESSSKQTHHMERGASARMSQDPPTDTERYFPNSASPIVFVDGNGRAVSPIYGESVGTDHDAVKEIDGWTGMPGWSTEPNTSFERNLPSEYQQAYYADNQISNPDDDPGQLSNSYVNFIEAVASVVIQTKVRQLLARIKVEKMRKQALRQQNHQSMRSIARKNFETSTVPMQRRSHTLTQKARAVNNRGKDVSKKDTALDFYTLAAIQIQAAFRGWWVRDCLAVDNYCATMIQKTYRGWLAVDASITKMYCIVRIQSIARGFLVRKGLRPLSHEQSIQDIAATIIQAQWRSFSCEMKYLRAYEDILLVQSVARGWITRRLIHSWLRAHNLKTPRRLVQSRSSFSTSKQQTTPPRRPGNVQNELSPSYVPHIEYMKSTLTPASSTQTSTTSFSSQNGRENLSSQPTEESRRLFSPSEGRQQKASVIVKKASKPQESRTQDSVKPTPQNTSAHQVSRNLSAGPASSTTARSEIEKRRKNKELEAKSKQEEERRRQEAQAAELAELEFRRKRMALKAEARKKEEDTPEEQEALVSDELENFQLAEEKKESDSIVQNTPEEEVCRSEPTRSEFVDSGKKERLFGRANLKKTPVAPWQLKENQSGPSGVVGHGITKNKDPVDDSGSAQNEGLSQREIPGPETPSVGKSTSPTSGSGGIIAARKQQLFMSTEKKPSTDEYVTSMDIEEMNSIVGKPTKDVSYSDTSENAEENDIAIADSTNKKLDACDSPNPKEMDVSALTEPTSFPEAAKPVVSGQRVSGTNASYQEQVRSQRSESEQKRLDEMHVIFQKAGLMSRTKRSAGDKYSQTADKEDPGSARTLLRAWNAKDNQTQPEITGKLF